MNIKQPQRPAKAITFFLLSERHVQLRPFLSWLRSCYIHLRPIEAWRLWRWLHALFSVRRLGTQERSRVISSDGGSWLRGVVLVRGLLLLLRGLEGEPRLGLLVGVTDRSHTASREERTGLEITCLKMQKVLKRQKENVKYPDVNKNQIKGCPKNNKNQSILVKMAWH